jgi:hypothetical protein
MHVLIVHLTLDDGIVGCCSAVAFLRRQAFAYVAPVDQVDRALEGGAFSNDDAKEAFESFTTLGILYLDCQMPRWLCRVLNAGLLTPLIKKPPVGDETPDARPTNA